MTKQEIEDCIKSVNAWASSPESQAALKKARKDAEDTIEKLEISRQVDWKDLHEPFTI